jgi:thiosulfate dehydrogenase
MALKNKIKSFFNLYKLFYAIIALALQITVNAEEKHYFQYDDNGKIISFDLVDPQFAPENCKEVVMKGFNIMRNTPKEMPQYCGNTLKCTNCHICAGNTLGQKNGGISLVGVTNKYPRYFERSKKTITLTERIQNCFERSMNGKAPPPDDEGMQAIQYYLKWISTVVKGDKDAPWLGLKLIESTHEPDLTQGALIYAQECASCHLPSGEGTEEAPPLWGPKSFNDGAGLSNLKPMASFVYFNMPYGNASLKEEEALDVAAFVLSHPRPKFKVKNAPVKQKAEQ